MTSTLFPEEEKHQNYAVPSLVRLEGAYPRDPSLAP